MNDWGNTIYDRRLSDAIDDFARTMEKSLRLMQIIEWIARGIMRLMAWLARIVPGAKS